MQDTPDNLDARPHKGFVGSLKEALAAASREDERDAGAAAPTMLEPPSRPADAEETVATTDPRTDPPNQPKPTSGPPAIPRQSAAEAAREARGGTPNIPPVKPPGHEEQAPPTTRIVRAEAAPANDSRTQLVRGRPPLERGEFKSDPVVGWLVIVGGQGIGAYRPIFEGNNTIGRAPENRIPIDFGDNAISGHEQAYIRYDSTDRSFLFVPNLAKTNVVSVNDKRPAAAVPLQAMDVITMGRTQLVFVPFCGPEFDWGELTNLDR